jgi:hypothetical protein
MKKVKMHSGCIGQEKVAIGELQPPAPFCRCKQLIDYKKANELVKRGEASWVVTKRQSVEVELECSMCLSMTDVEKKTCGQCNGTGKIKAIREIPSYNEDIVLLSSKAVDPSNKRYRWNMGAKTPRVPTIESKHIQRAFITLAKPPQQFRDFVEDVRRNQKSTRLGKLIKGIEQRNIGYENILDAYVFEDNYAAKRIEEYGDMNQEELGSFGAELRDAKTGKIIKPGKLEPADEATYFPPGSITFRDGSKNKLGYWKIEGRRFDYGRAL